MTANYANIPAELRALQRWCVWRYEDGGSKPTKVPYCSTNQHMSVNDPATWLPFEQAVELGKQFDGIGFVFNNDGYTFIDLDDTNGDQAALNRQIDINREMDSYSEISPSGKGLHIIVKGNVPAGRRRSHIEVYSSQRYATFTGDIYNRDSEGQPKSIAERQDKLTQLWEQMGSGPVAHTFTGDEKERYTDEQIIEQCKAAVNGGKFTNLFMGNWKDDYPSQSEADLAIINIISFYTKNRQQIERIFKRSALGHRIKASRKDYIERLILRSFDRELPPIDFDGFKNQLEMQLVNGHKIEVETIIKPSEAIALPPGLLGELAQFIYAAAPLPVPVIALAGAIGLMAGICGRAYNVNGEGLNQYILLIAQSGTGKEAMASGIDKLIDAIKMQCPTSSRIVGPAEITSGEALIRHINKPFNQCFVSILSEFGYRLQMLSDKRNFAQSSLKRILLQLYHMAGKGRMYKPKIFSDKDKDIGETHSPALSILAESTPSTLYECVTEEIIADGFLPRFIILEYKGERVPLNKNMLVLPNMTLTNNLAAFFAHCEMLAHTQRITDVAQTDEVKAESERFEEYARNMINKNDREDTRQLWNRAHIKAWKLAALVAVGVNAYNPIIQIEHWTWALNIIKNDIRALSSKFETGEVGATTSEMNQQRDLSRIIRDWITRDWEYCKKYSIGKNDKQLHHDKILPYAYISRRLINVASFLNDTRKATPALKSAIQVLIDSDKLREIGALDKSAKYNTTQKCYVISDPKAFDI